MQYLFIFLTVGVICVAIANTCQDYRSSYEKKSKERKLENKISELKQKFKCDNVDECIAKYQFEGARAMAGESENKDDELYKVVAAEIAFWSKEKDFERAKNILDESSGTLRWKDDAIGSLRLNLFNNAVLHYCEQKDWKNAQIWALKAPESLQGKLKATISEFKKLSN